MKDPRYQYPGEVQVESPDGTDYIVRVAGSGVERPNVWLGYLPLFTRLVWFPRKRRRWTVQVFALGAVSIERPALLSETFDSELSAVARSEQVVREISAGKLGWDRWHRRTGGGDSPRAN